MKAQLSPVSRVNPRRDLRISSRILSIKVLSALGEAPRVVYRYSRRLHKGHVRVYPPIHAEIDFK